MVDTLKTHLLSPNGYFRVENEPQAPYQRALEMRRRVASLPLGRDTHFLNMLVNDLSLKFLESMTDPKDQRFYNAVLPLSYNTIGFLNNTGVQTPYSQILRDFSTKGTFFPSAAMTVGEYRTDLYLFLSQPSLSRMREFPHWKIKAVQLGILPIGVTIERGKLRSCVTQDNNVILYKHERRSWKVEFQSTDDLPPGDSVIEDMLYADTDLFQHAYHILQQNT